MRWGCGLVRMPCRKRWRHQGGICGRREAWRGPQEPAGGSRASLRSRADSVPAVGGEGELGFQQVAWRGQERKWAPMEGQRGEELGQRGRGFTELLQWEERAMRGSVVDEQKQGPRPVRAGGEQRDHPATRVASGSDGHAGPAGLSQEAEGGNREVRRWRNRGEMHVVLMNGQCSPVCGIQEKRTSCGSTYG